MPHPRLLLALIAAFALALFGQPHDSILARNPAVEPSAQEAAQESAAQQLADRYAPIVFTKEQREDCDTKGEAYYPMAVEPVLDNPEITLLDDGTVVGTAPGASSLYEQGETFYLDLPGNPKRPECGYEQAFKALEADPVVYAHLTNEDGRDELVLQYWLYFYFNDWNNNHESDWEFIQLVFDAATPEEALATAPDRVIFSQHGGGETANWTDSKLRKEGDRPVVYVAKGSHALQYGPENHLGKGEHGTGFGCDDATGPSVRVDPEARVIPSEVSGQDDPYAWITYEGRWGERQSGEFNGPTGPNTKKPWMQPLTWMDAQRDSSVTVPQESIGPNAAEAFCNIVAFGSRLLFGGGIYVVIGVLVAIGGTIGITANKTDFRPVITEPLAQRRKFGQMLRTAFRIERQRWPLFFGIGAVFVPLGVITGLLQSLIIDNPPVEPMLDLIDVRAVEAVAALAIGALQFGIAYWFVRAAATAALGHIEANDELSIVSAHAEMVRRAPALLRARIPATVATVLLALTIVGIPFALYFGTRWLFIECEVLLAGRERAEARRASDELVRGRTWYTFGVSAAVNVTGIVIGPLIGVLIVLFTSAPLLFVNVLSSLVYLALIPFVAIALTLLYYDLKVERAEE